MLSNRSIPGDVCQHEQPDWEPLRALVGMTLADWFMWMFEVELADGTRLHVYKHIATRGYFHLAHDGRAFVYRPRGRYCEIEPRLAIDLVFEDWDVLAPEPRDPQAVRAALRSARRAATVRSERRQACPGAAREPPDEWRPAA